MYEDHGRCVTGQVGRRKGSLRCPLPFLSPSTGRASWCEDLWRKEKRDPELVGTCERYLKDYNQLFHITEQCRTEKCSGGILTHRVKSLSVYYSGMA